MAEGRNNDEMYNESELKDDKKNDENQSPPEQSSEEKTENIGASSTISDPLQPIGNSGEMDSILRFTEEEMDRLRKCNPDIAWALGIKNPNVEDACWDDISDDNKSVNTGGQFNVPSFSDDSDQIDDHTFDIDSNSSEITLFGEEMNENLQDAAQYYVEAADKTDNDSIEASMADSLEDNLCQTLEDMELEEETKSVPTENVDTKINDNFNLPSSSSSCPVSFSRVPRPMSPSTGAIKKAPKQKSKKKSKHTKMHNKSSLEGIEESDEPVESAVYFRKDIQNAAAILYGQSVVPNISIDDIMESMYVEEMIRQTRRCGSSQRKILHPSKPRKGSPSQKELNIKETPSTSFDQKYMQPLPLPERKKRKRSEQKPYAKRKFDEHISDATLALGELQISEVDDSKPDTSKITTDTETTKISEDDSDKNKTTGDNKESAEEVGIDVLTCNMDTSDINVEAPHSTIVKTSEQDKEKTQSDDRTEAKTNVSVQSKETQDVNTQCDENPSINVERVESETQTSLVRDFATQTDIEGSFGILKDSSTQNSESESDESEGTETKFKKGRLTFMEMIKRPSEEDVN